MKKAVATVIVILGICSIFLHAKSTDGYSMEESEMQGDVSGKGKEIEEIYPDEWEAEYVEAISMSYTDGVTQDDINRIGQYRHLKKLVIYIYDEELDLSPLSNLRELETIELIAHAMSNKVDISFLSDLTELKEFSFYGGNIKDYSFFNSLHQLREIYITRNNTISDLSFFSDMPNLKTLDIAHVHDADLSYLANLKNIEKIHIGGSHIRNMEVLANLSQVKELSLFEYDAYGEERLTIDLHLLDGMTELESLTLLYINIEDISPLADKQLLRTIILVDTGIEDIEPIKKLNKLRWLQICGNESEKVKEQSEQYFQDVKDVDVSEKIPDKYSL